MIWALDHFLWDPLITQEKHVCVYAHTCKDALTPMYVQVCVGRGVCSVLARAHRDFRLMEALSLSTLIFAIFPFCVWAYAGGDWIGIQVLKHSRRALCHWMHLSSACCRIFRQGLVQLNWKASKSPECPCLLFKQHWGYRCAQPSWLFLTPACTALYRTVC